MKILDRHGRLFGLINIIDLLLVVIIAAGIFAVAQHRLVWGEQARVHERQPIEVVFVVEAVREPTLRVIHPGNEVVDSRTNTYLGTVTHVEAEPATIVYHENDGRIHETTSPSRVDIWVTVRGPAAVSSNLIQLGQTEIRIGVQVPLKTNIYAVSSRVMYVNLSPDT